MQILPLFWGHYWNDSSRLQFLSNLNCKISRGSVFNWFFYASFLGFIMAIIKKLSEHRLLLQEIINYVTFNAL